MCRFEVWGVFFDRVLGGRAALIGRSMANVRLAQGRLSIAFVRASFAVFRPVFVRGMVIEGIVAGVRWRCWWSVKLLIDDLFRSR